MLEKNSPRVTVDSEPDQFGTSAIKDRSLCTVGVGAYIRSLIRCSSFFVSANSAMFVELYFCATLYLAFKSQVLTSSNL